VQVETAASTTGAVVGTRFDVPLATRVEERVSAGLPASAHATPMTFEGRRGRQYVVIAAGGGGFLRALSPALSDALVAYALPK
jgi:glucose dehydrogenase